MRAKSQNISIVLSALREKRITILAWFISGAIAMYFEAIAIAAELRDYPGGPVALAKSIMPTIEGLRIIRWPADRLDTLGGYLTYHNVVLFNYFLALFAATQGARLIRHLEESKDMEFYLATGVSRSRMISFRSLAYFISQIIISLGLGAGTAFALAASNEANTSGSLLTLLAGGICIFPFFALGLLVSQFVSSSRTAAGLTSIVITAIYLLGNIGDKYSWLHWVKYISPFHYANLSRPVIPGFKVNYLSWLLMIAIGLLMILISIKLFNLRDVASVSIVRIESEKKDQKIKKEFVPKTVIGDLLWRQRVGLLAWTITTTVFITVFISMMSGIVDIWEKFAFLQQFATGGFGNTAAQQYLAMVFEILPPFIAGFIIVQSSKWTAELNQGRVQYYLTTPISWSGLIIRRYLTTLIGVSFLIFFSISAIIASSKLQGVQISGAGLFRVIAMALLLALAFTSLNVLIVAILHGKNATQIISIYIGAAWMIGFMAPYLKWPSWVIRFSIFDAFGHPFVQWPGTANFLLIFIMAIPGLLLGMFIAERSSKVL